MSKTEKAISEMERMANDSRYGYSQAPYRWGEDGGSYDCSSAVITAWEKAGVPVKTRGATYTGNMKRVFIACGFKDVTSTVNLRTGTGLKRGDVLLNERKHVAMYCGNGLEVEASINEKGTATGGKVGDQSGKEFLIRSYRNYPFDCVLRYPETAAATTAKKSIAEVAKDVIAGKYGSGDARKKKLTAEGYDAAAVQAEVNKQLGATGQQKKSVATIAREVVAGKWGSGETRKKKLKNAGYDYTAVQTEVNRLLGTPAKKSVDAIAKEVIAGKWGKGQDRCNKLTKAGYNYAEIQKRVNQLLK